MPHTSSVPLGWRTRRNRYMLTGTRCSSCLNCFFPPRSVCPACGTRGSLTDHCLEAVGEVVSFTTINAAPGGFENQAPYTIGLIKLRGGPNITAQIVNAPEKIKTGARVCGVFRKITTDGPGGLITYGIKFKIVG